MGLVDLRIAPIFPSLIQEGQSGGGYDVALDLPGVPLFLQFKLSEQMVRQTAYEAKKAIEFGVPLEVPFRRFHITPSYQSEQHAMLLELDRSPNFVFYVAPRFRRDDELNQAWRDRAVAARSIFIRPRDIGPQGFSEEHSIAFKGADAWRFSEPKKVNSVQLDQVVLELEKQLDETKAPVRDQVLEWSASFESAEEIARRKVRETRDMEAIQDTLTIQATQAIRSRSAEVSHAEDAETGKLEIREANPVDEEILELQRVSDRARHFLGAQMVVVQRMEGK